MTLVTNKAVEFGEKTQTNGYYAVQGRLRSFKVNEVSIRRKPVCDCISVIN